MARIINTADIVQGAYLDPNTSYWIYNGLDCCVTREVFDNIVGFLDATTQHTYDFSRALQAPVLEMSMRGLLVNQNRRAKTINEFRVTLAILEDQFDRICIEGLGINKVNWRSPTQLNWLLYTVLGLPVQKKRNTKGVYAPFSGREALENLSIHFLAEPICIRLLALRDVGKSLGFLLTGIDPDGRMRTSINIAGTNTGRWASSASDFGTGTNLQNVTESLRSVFVADPGMKFANLDLEQADSRNLGALIWEHLFEEMGEKEAGRYLDACEAGDLHTYVCKLCNPQLPWGTAPDRQIADQFLYRTKSYRDGSKVLGHGSNYLGTPITMAKHTKFPVQLVKHFQFQYFANFPAIPKYHQYVLNNLTNFASLTTLFGRRRFFFGRPDDAATLREAVAYSPQSMTGDEINEGILKLWRANRIQLLMQVHDSILFQYPEEMEAEILPWALKTLQVPITLRGGREFVVPTEAKVGWNWGNNQTWSKKDLAEGRCKEADIGKCNGVNPDGLIKYKGGDSRTRTETESLLTIRGM